MYYLTKTELKNDRLGRQVTFKVSDKGRQVDGGMHRYHSATPRASG